MIDIPLEWILRLHLFATLWMVGLIWFVQRVHYPLMGKVPADQFMAYEQAHTARTVAVTAPLMLLELGLGGLLVWLQPVNLSPHEVRFAFALSVVNWLSTFYLQIPCHQKLSEGFDPAVHRKLVQTNWIRTMAWTLRGMLVVTWPTTLP